MLWMRILIVLLLLSGCQTEDLPEPEIITNPGIDDSPGGSTCDKDSMECVVDANNEFAFKIFNELSGENIFLSPWSISTALAMTYEGARGKTALEMAQVLNMVETDDRRIGFGKLYESINRDSKDFQLSTANALWAQKSYSFLDTYFSNLEKYYSGKLSSLDFVGETENSRQIINSWVEDQTEDKIKDLIPPGAINKLTRLVLTNAVYFKGTWVYEFDKDITHNADFTNKDETITVQMMQRTDEDVRYGYYENDEVQVLEMPYEGERLSMVAILPKDMQDIKVSAVSYETWVGKLNKQRVKVFFPKFKFETKYMMKETLARMGMPTAFSMDADFSGMTGNLELYISKVIHQAFVDVNEKGTEAAAATAVVMTLKTTAPMNIPVFKADHPFVFIIRDKETGSILFMGQVNDPTA